MTTVLISIPWFYPAFRAGGPVQSIVNMVNKLNNDYKFFIFCGNTDLNNSPLDNIETDKWVQYNEYTKVWYASAGKRNSTLVNQAKTINPDVLFIIGIYSLYFNLIPLLVCKAKRQIVSVRGMLHPGALSQKKIKKKIYLALWKILKLHNHCSFHSTSEEEKTYIKSIFGSKAKVFVAQNFPRIFDKLPFLKKDVGELQLVSIALISPMKNILLVLEALQAFGKKISYNIYGPIKDNLYWQKCLLQIEKLPQNIAVTYHGDIAPVKVLEVLQKTHVFILPSKSENFGHAIYEALTAGKPVITSNHTPWNNLQALKSGINVSINNNNEIINALTFFLNMDQYIYNEWCTSAASYAGNAIDINKIKNQYQQMFSSLS